jgi:sugar lactone lactonase YvrE
VNGARLATLAASLGLCLSAGFPVSAVAAGARPDSSIAADAPARRDSAAADSLPLVLRLTATIAPAQDAPGRLARPAGVALDAFGRLYVTDGALHRLQRYEADGRWIGQSGALGSGAGDLRHPGSVVPAGALLMAVLDVENRRIVTYDLFGRLQGVPVDLTAQALSDVEGRIDPVALASDRGGSLYVADADGERLLVFDASGRLVRSIGRLGSGPGAFRGLWGVAVSRTAEIFTTERVNARVQRLDAIGRARGAWPLPVRGARAALPVAVDDSLHVAVADEGSGRVWVYDRDGRLLAARAGLSGPQALAFAPAGVLWVAEAGGGRIARFDLTARDPDEPVPEGK